MAGPPGPWTPNCQRRSGTPLCIPNYPPPFTHREEDKEVTPSRCSDRSLVTLAEAPAMVSQEVAGAMEAGLGQQGGWLRPKAMAQVTPVRGGDAKNTNSEELPFVGRRRDNSLGKGGQRSIVGGWVPVWVPGASTVDPGVRRGQKRCGPVWTVDKDHECWGPLGTCLPAVWCREPPWALREGRSTDLRSFGSHLG